MAGEVNSEPASLELHGCAVIVINCAHCYTNGAQIWIEKLRGRIT